MNKEERDKVLWIIGNTVLNSLEPLKEGQDYNYWEEALKWAKSKDYFPDLTTEQFLAVARKYDEWDEFEKLCEEAGYKHKCYDCICYRSKCLYRNENGECIRYDVAPKCGEDGCLIENCNAVKHGGIKVRPW